MIAANVVIIVWRALILASLMAGLIFCKQEISEPPLLLAKGRFTLNHPCYIEYFDHPPMFLSVTLLLIVCFFPKFEVLHQIGLPTFAPFTS